MRNDRRQTLALLIAGAIPVTWAAILAAPFVSGGLLAIVSGMGEALQSPFTFTFCADTPKTILMFLSLYAMGVGVYYSTARNYRKREEHGSAKWGDAASLNRKYADRNKTQNKILTQSVSIGFDSHRHRRNLNVLVVGGSGSGKTRFYAKPNIMQSNGSLVVLDPKGEILRDTGELLIREGYKLRVLDLMNMTRSHCYNPFEYIQTDADVLKLVTNLIRNTTPKGSNTNDPFWEKSETALLEALILYLLSQAPKDEQNFPMVMEMIAAAGASEENESYQSPLDVLFMRLKYRDEDNIAVKQYDIFRQAAGKTAKSILISVGVRLAAFNLRELSGITQADELELPKLGEEKRALFALIPDNDSSFNFIIGMLYTQLFQQLYYIADHVHGGRLPIHVHFVMDEFSNVALPDEFDKLLSTMRSREISVSIVLQNLAQLKALYEKQWESIVGNCDEFVYLGGNEQSTHKYVSELLGKETIDLNTYGHSRGRNGNYSTNWQLTGRELMTPDEVRMLDNQYALLFIRGERPVKDFKYDLLKHPNIRFTADVGAKVYNHGALQNALDWASVKLAAVSKYELISDEELQEELGMRATKTNIGEEQKNEKQQEKQNKPRARRAQVS